MGSCVAKQWVLQVGGVLPPISGIGTNRWCWEQRVYKLSTMGDVSLSPKVSLSQGISFTLALKRPCEQRVMHMLSASFVNVQAADNKPEVLPQRLTHGICSATNRNFL